MVRSEARPRREALHDTIQQRIERYIIESGSRTGDALPSQQEMARSLGISMPSLREAMKSLEALGVVEVRQGAGTYVGRFSLDAFVDGLAFRIRLEAGGNRRTMAEMLDIRMILERSYVRQVAENPDPAHITALYGLVEQMTEIAARGEHFPREDCQFHELLYRPVNNAMLEMLVRGFWDLAAIVRNELGAELVDPITIANFHRQIVDAVAIKDPDLAAAAMEAHFVSVRANVHQP